MNINHSALESKIAKAQIGLVDDALLLHPRGFGLTSLGIVHCEWEFSYYRKLNDIIEPCLAQIRYAMDSVPALIDGLKV